MQIPDRPEFTNAVDLRGPTRHVVHVHEAHIEIENGVSARPTHIDVGERSIADLLPALVPILCRMPATIV